MACDQGHITAHKQILCHHSKYLHDILSKHPNAEHPIIILTEPNIIDIKILVNYMYTGELVITNDSSPTSLLRAAQILKIDSLTDDVDSPEEELAELGSNSSAGSGGEESDCLTTQSLQPILASYNQQLQERLQEQLQSQLNQQSHHHHHHHHHQHHNSSSSQIVGATTITTSNQHSNLQEEPLDLQDFQDSNNHLDSKNNKIRCHLCNIGLSDVKCLYRHVLTRHLPEKWGYKCEFCDREFSRDDHLMRHYTTKHKNMEFNREKIRETRRLNREMAKNFHDQISTA